MPSFHHNNDLHSTHDAPALGIAVRSAPVGTSEEALSMMTLAVIGMLVGSALGLRLKVFADVRFGDLVFETKNCVPFPTAIRRRMSGCGRTPNHGRWIRSLAQALDRRTHLRLDQPLPAPGARLRALRQNRRRLHPSRHDPHHAQAACCKSFVMNPNFADGALMHSFARLRYSSPVDISPTLRTQAG